MKAGRKYEAAVQKQMDQRYGECYLPSPSFQYIAGSYVGLCQADGIIFNPESGEITVIECKLKHTPGAYFQLWELYGPIIKILFPENLWKYKFCEICAIDSPGLKFPGKIRYVDWPEETPTVDKETTGVCLWNTRNRGYRLGTNRGRTKRKGKKRTGQSRASAKV